MAFASDARRPQRRRQQRCAPSSSPLLPLAAAAATMLLLLLSFSAPASAATHGAVFTRDARPVVTIVPAFSFGNDGYIDIEITKWEYWHKKGADGIDLQRVAFVAADSAAAAAVAAAAARGECPLDAPRAVRLLDFEQVDYNRREGFNATFFNGRLLELVPKYKGGGTFSLLYVNCEAAYAVASFQARASLYSVLPGGGRDFLPAGLGPLEGVYGCAAASAAAVFALWAWTCASGRRYLSFSFGAAPAAALGAGLLAALTGLSLFAARGAAAAVRARGQAPAWAAASAGLELARVASLFGMLLLAGRGVGWGACGGGGGGGGGRGGAGLAALFAAASRRTCAGSPSCGVPAVPALLSSPRDARIVSVVLPLQIAVELALALVRGAASPAAPAADGSGGVGLSLSALLSLSGSSASASVPSSSSLAAFGAPGTRARDALYLAAAAGAVAVLAQVGWSERRAASRVAAGSSLSPASRGGGSASASASITNDAKAGRVAASGALWRRWYTCALLGVYGGRAAAALAAAVVPLPRGAWAPAAVGAAASLALALSAVLECCPGPTCEYGLLTLGLGNAASASVSGRQAGNGREAEMSLRAGGGRMS